MQDLKTKLQKIIDDSYRIVIERLEKMSNNSMIERLKNLDFLNFDKTLNLELMNEKIQTEFCYDYNQNQYFKLDYPKLLYEIRGYDLEFIYQDVYNFVDTKGIIQFLYKNLTDEKHLRFIPFDLLKILLSINEYDYSKTTKNISILDNDDKNDFDLIDFYYSPINLFYYFFETKRKDTNYKYLLDIEQEMEKIWIGLNENDENKLLTYAAKRIDIILEKFFKSKILSSDVINQIQKNDSDKLVDKIKNQTYDEKVDINLSLIDVENPNLKKKFTANYPKILFQLEYKDLINLYKIAFKADFNPDNMVVFSKTKFPYLRGSSIPTNLLNKFYKLIIKTEDESFNYTYNASKEYNDKFTKKFNEEVNNSIVPKKIIKIENFFLDPINVFFYQKNISIDSYFNSIIKLNDSKLNDKIDEKKNLIKSN